MVLVQLDIHTPGANQKNVYTFTLYCKQKEFKMDQRPQQKAKTSKSR